MQGILISLATAVILAIGGAFAAPFVVDWNTWRGTFETEIGRALGLPIVIRGPIDAEILPAPRVTLRDVTLGDVVSTGGTVKEMTAELSLGALLRGDVEATGVRLDRPQIRLVLDSAGRLALPTGAARPTDLSIARLEVKGGSLDLLDRASDRTASLTGLDVKGEARSLSGPFRLDGELDAAGTRFALRASLGKIGDDGAGRLKLALDGRTGPYAVDLDGNLNLSGARPRFDGKATLARRGGEGLDAWQLSGTLKASPESVLADNLDLALGGAQTPAQLSGSGKLTLGRAVGLDAVLNARSLDLDALWAAGERAQSPRGAAPQPADQNPAGALTRFLGGVAGLPAPDIASRIGLSVEQLMLGGTLVRDVRADITGAASGWRVDTAEAQLPGKAALRLSGTPSRAAGGGFDGSVTFSADDPAVFLRWAAPAAPREYVAAAKGPVRITGKVSAGPSRIAVENLDATFAASRVRGSANAALDAGAPPKINLRLSLDGFDLDPLVAALQTAAAAVGGGADGALQLDGRNLTLSGLPLRGLNFDASATGGNWRLQRIVLDDLAGIRIEGAGRMENFSTTPRGEFNVSASGTRADGLVPLARLVAGEQTAQVVSALAPIAAPVKLASTVVWSEAGGRNISIAGSMGQLTGDVTFARSNAGVPLRIALKGDATDGARFLGAFGVESLGLTLGQRLGPARIELSVDPLAPSEAQVRGKLALADITAQLDGTARIAGGTIEPSFAVRLDGGDLGRVLPQAAAAAEGPVPSALAFTLARRGAGWRLDAISGSLAAAPVSGYLDFEPGPVPRFGGKLAFDSLSLPRILATFAARTGTDAPATAGPWSAARIQPASVSGLGLNLELSAGRLAVLGPYALGNARLLLGSEGGDIDVRDMSGAIGGGRAAASLRVRRQADLLQADGRLVLEDVDAAALVAPAGPRQPPRGRVNLLLDLGGSGRSVMGVVQALSGQGTLGVRDLVIEGVSPTALEAVLGETATLPAPPDERRAAQMLDRALARGPLRIGFVETTLGVVNGTARLSPARSTAEGVRVGFGGSFDLARLAMDASVDLEGPEGSGGVPGGSVAWRGPVTNPERRVAAAALTSVVAMRAIERETRRLEERQGRVVPDGTAPAAALPPAVPALRPAPAPASVSPAAPAPQAAPAPIPPTPPAPAAPAPAAPSAARPAPAPVQAAPAPVTPPPPAPAAPAAARPAPAPVPSSPQAAPAPAAPGRPAQAAPETQAARPAPAQRPAAPQGIERQDAPPAGFGAPTASGAAGTATPGDSSAARPESRPTTSPATERRPAVARQAPPRRERPQELQPPPRLYAPAPSEPTLPPTRGFGDLPRPPGLVGGQ